MSSKRKSDGKSRAPKKAKKNGKSKHEDLSDFDDEFGSDVSNEGSNSANHTDNEDVGNEVDLPADDDTLRVKGPDHVGKVLICGATNWDLVARKTVPKGCKNANKGRDLFTPHLFAPLSDIRVHVVVSGCNAAHSVIITENWKAMVFGRNEKGQLGTGNTDRSDVPVELEELKDLTIVGAACGRNHTLFLTDRGHVYACGDNKMGQCGVGSTSQTVDKPTRIRYKGPPIVKVACGAEFSMILDCKGSLYSFGSPEYGQLGHNTTGEYIQQSGKVNHSSEKSPKMIMHFIEKNKDHITPVEGVDIRDVACGTNHTIALDSRKRIFSWGFGGYGRLGHADTKDELVPRIVKFFETQGKGIKGIYCGSSFSICVNEFKVAYLFGQTKKTGEANMYPKPMQDLYGWNIRSVGCGITATVLAADNSVISFGPSPAFGELGHGVTRKSTTTAMEVRALEGIYVEQVAMGMHHTLLLARDETEAEKDKINELPEYDPA
ncbi:protein RCC2 homolog [Homalodisca vitripennis]|nr:protein RCC2 homolog [Homalodisca vitripennis]